MKKSRYTQEQIIAVLKQHQAGVPTAELCRKHGISEATFYNWRSRYGGMEGSEARRLKSLEEENRQLKKLVARQMHTPPRPHPSPGGLTPSEFATRSRKDHNENRVQL